MTTVGLLYPGHHCAADDYPRIEVLLNSDIRLPVFHTDLGEDDLDGAGTGDDSPGGDSHRADALRQMGAGERLAEGVEELRLAGAQSVVWACTSGSSVYGWDGAHQQTRALAVAAGLPASSTSFAFVHAVQALGAERVAVAAACPGVTGYFTDFLKAAGTEVVAALRGETVAPAEAAAWELGQVLELARAGDHQDAEVVLLPDTSLHTAAYLPELEEALGKPVLTATQVTVWEGLRLAERRAWAPKLGTLFATRE
jgi:maleate cis-trans isomerase